VKLYTEILQFLISYFFIQSVILYTEILQFL